MPRVSIMIRLFGLLAMVTLLWSGGVRHALAEEGAKPPEVHAGGEMSKTQKPKPKVRPKRPDKEKDCQYDRSEELEIDAKTVTVTQETIKGVMAGHEAEQDGYSFYANTTLLVFYIRNPDGAW